MWAWLVAALLLRNPFGEGGEIIAVRFPRCEPPLQQVIFALLFAGAATMVWWMYRREPPFVSLRRRRVLGGLRTAAWAVVLFIISGAYLEITRGDEDAKGTLALVVDRSLSMTIVDKRVQTEDVEAARAILGLKAGGRSGGGKEDGEGKKEGVDPGKATRDDLLRSALADPDTDPVIQVGKQHRLAAFLFGQSQGVAPFELRPGPAGGLAELQAPKDNATQLGGAIADAARRLRGRRVDGLVVFTDGGSNRGDDPVEAAKACGVPVYPVGVGLARVSDMEVPWLSCEDVAFKNDRFPVTVRIRSHGYPNRTATLQIKMSDGRNPEVVMKEEEVDLGDEKEQVRTVEILPDREGLYTVAAELVPFPDEHNLVNNRRAKSGVRVVDRKLRVLVADEGPRWEYRFIKFVLEADRQRISPSFVLSLADIEPGSKLKKQLPTSMAEYRQLDAIILGDLPPEQLPPAVLKLIEEWVREEGGGLMVVAGRNGQRGGMPAAFNETVLAQMLPVEVDPQPPFTVEDERQRSVVQGFRPQLTPEGARWLPLRLSPEAPVSERLWSECEPLKWFVPVKRLKPGATSLLAHPVLKCEDQPMPILAMQRYGKGQVVFLASDETWRWRFKPGSAQHRRLWGQMVNTLGLAHALGSASRTTIDTDRTEYQVGDRAQIIARLLGPDYNPVLADRVTAVIERELSRETVTLAVRKGQLGTFEGEWVPSAEGVHRITIQGGDPSAERMVGVITPRIELDDQGVREDLLNAVAKESGGRYFPLHRLQELWKALSERSKEDALRRDELTLWNAPGVIILLALLLGMEWLIRKRSDLL